MVRSQYARHKIRSHISVDASVETVWKHITRVQIEQFADPWYFHMLDIPKPIHAEITQPGEDGQRIAYFVNGKRFNQQILTWKEPETYAFTFEPEPNFRVGWFFDLANGPFQLVSGAYYLHNSSNDTKLTLETTYQVAARWQWVLRWPVRRVLKLFQRYLLQSIKQITEKDG